MDRLSEAPPRENVRRMLRSELLTDEDFDAFCIDYFPAVAQRLSGGLNRVQKENLLLQMISPALINQRLNKQNLDEQNARRLNLKAIIAIGLLVLIGVMAIAYGFIYGDKYQKNTPLQSGGKGEQLEKTVLPAIVKPVPVAVPVTAPVALPETNTPPPETKAQSPGPGSKVAPMAAKPSRPVNSKTALPASRPGPVQVNRIDGNQGNVTIIQNNN